MFDGLRDRLALADRSADDYLTYAGHAAPGAVVLEDGTHLAVLSLGGKPLALLDDAERYAERRRRHAVLRAMADTNVQVCEHLVSHDLAEPFRPAGFRPGYARDLAADYHAATDRGLLRREWFLSIMAKPQGVAGALGGLRRAAGRSDAELLRQVEDRVAVVLDTLPDYAPRRLGVRHRGGVPFSEIGEALRLILYGRWAPVPVPAGRLADAIYADRLICGLRGFEVRGAGASSYGVLFGLLDYVERAPPRLLDPLLAMPGRFVMTNSFAFLSRGKVTESLGLLQRQMANSNDRAVSLAGGLGDAMDEVASGRGLMGDHHFSVAAHVDRHEDLPAAASRMGALLVNCGLPVATESWGCEPALWAQLPGSPAWLRTRHGPISGYNFAAFSSLSGEPKGGGRGEWGAPVLRLRTAAGSAHDFHPHVNGVGHFLAFGPSGCGKTTFLGLMGALLEPCVAAKGGAAVFLDADGSNELTVLACGGHYAKVRRGEASGMAPFKALRNTPDACAWLLEFALGLVTSDGGPLPSPQQQDRLRFGIQFLMRRPAALRSFAALRQFADHAEGGCGERLERWCRGGSLGWAFDGEEDLIRFEAGINGVDNSEVLVDDAAAVREPMAAYQLFRIGERVGTGLPGAVLVDEAQAYLPGPRFAAGFERFVTRLRKGNGILGMAMQQPQAILRHAIGQSLVSNTPTKLLFANTAAELDAYRGGLHCTEGELAAVREGMLGMGRGTFLMKRDAGSFVARADLSALPDHVAVLSANPRRRALAHRIIAEVGPEPARWVPEYRRRHAEAERP